MPNPATMLFWVDVMVPIQRIPETIDTSLNYSSELSVEFNFTSSNTFRRIPAEAYDGEWLIDDQQRSYYCTRFDVSSLQQMKWVRQIWRPSYMDPSISLPLMNRMRLTGDERLSGVYRPDAIQPIWTHFDKAIAHVNTLIVTDPLSDPSLLSRLANCDGMDDPQVTRQLHYMTNTFDQAKTVFIPGICTASIATVSNNIYYMNEIHHKQVSKLYLLYYTYYHLYGKVPSKQMMPQLLGNLWRSVEPNTQNWNPNLFQKMKLQ